MKKFPLRKILPVHIVVALETGLYRDRAENMLWLEYLLIILILWAETGGVRTYAQIPRIRNLYSLSRQRRDSDNAVMLSSAGLVAQAMAGCSGR